MSVAKHDFQAELRHHLTPQWMHDFDQVWNERERPKADYESMCGALLALLDYTIRQGINKKMTYSDISYVMQTIFNEAAGK